ncbi:hypothetical protein GDO86_005152 [Hymenochirus boettgeri]|uniref:RAD51 interacting motif domain-containing protein n=1 Tax=Hymenochirus boettgeri TaxID=247094 RepID=A0A8T2J514_9PIPI|nr:hypothetical protein GDO86_005152 [Hymenochirus boettgeri]
MDRPVRNKKSVDYSQFGDLDNDDEDFAISSAPPNKKPRVETKKEKKEKPAKKSNKPDSLSQQGSQGKRIPLDDKLYRRDLQVALTLSAQNTTAQVESRNNNDVITINNDLLKDTADHSQILSNCSVDSSALGLDAIIPNSNNPLDGRNRREAATKAIREQRKILADDVGDEEAEDEFKPDTVADDEDSESESSGEDEEFEVKKNKKPKANKGLKQNDKTEKKEKKQAKPRATASSASPVSSKAKPLPAKRGPISSPAPAKQVVNHSSPSGVRKPTWSPPASIGSVKSPLVGVTVKSPNQGLRLGLSRLARVKPLHPTLVNN